MQQVYHSNAVTNLHIRNEIRNSNLTNLELANKYNTSKATVSKWKNRDELTDLSSAPNSIKYALSYIEQSLVVSIRKTTWLPLDEVWEMLLEQNTSITRSSVYRTFCRNDINKVPQEKREKAKKFKEYEPGYLHIDVTYLPKFDGDKCYLFVAIDRATRTLYYEAYDAKTSENAESFMKNCLEFFPFEITHVLTDNGLEFTNRLIKSKKGNLCTKPSKLDVVCEENNIDHRLTKPATPKTNGMVERVNGTIKNGTILKETYKNKEEMILSLNTFLIHYMLYRRHGGLRKELNVKTPFNAIEKWYELKPELFIQNPLDFKTKLLILNQHYYTRFCIQPCET
ncbi:MAG: DDE-type integrase/transposase/recombinase [Bacteroidetes bacterium]|nr:DDE-type integrase/transposase/recombinase [Bacteroidota bacterium]